ncbi:hypothetical protein MKY04_16190 [Lysinibacillus telephonicus]|uniref:hypothetical protein n=1 Tax=Lysinibacillus telephonicus TaxID=1714840 RepID=UPI0031FBE45A
MARRINAADRLKHDDSWLKSVQDVITKQTHEVKIFVDVKRTTVVTIQYDNLKEVITICDEYDDCTKAKAFYESFRAFVDELPHGINLKVISTNVGYLINEILMDKRPNAARMRKSLEQKGIKLINEKREKWK